MPVLINSRQALQFLSEFVAAISSQNLVTALLNLNLNGFNVGITLIIYHIDYYILQCSDCSICTCV